MSKAKTIEHLLKSYPVHVENRSFRHGHKEKTEAGLCPAILYKNYWSHPRRSIFETFDIDKFLGYLTEDAVYRCGNYPAAVGKEAIAATIKASQMDQITDIVFDVKNVYEKDDAVVSELGIIYSLVNGKTITLPCVDVFRFDGEKVKEMLIFMDASPLFAP